MNKNNDLKIMWFQTIAENIVFFMKFAIVIGLMTYCLKTFGEMGALFAILLFMSARIGYPSVTYNKDV